MYKLPTRQELLDAGAPYGITKEGSPLGREDTEWLRTEPDVVVYTPDILEEGGNEMVCVEEVPVHNCMFAVWQQNSWEGSSNDRVLYSRSKDGKIWEKAKMLAGVRPGKGDVDCVASCPFMAAAPSGRIYVFYIAHTEPIKEIIPYDYLTGLLLCTYTDNCGETWSEPVKMKRRWTPWDLPGQEEVQCNAAIQSPQHLKDGRLLISYTKFVPTQICPDVFPGGQLVRNMRASFAVIENFADSPKPEDFVMTWLPDDARGLGLGGEEGLMDPMERLEEPFTVELPNGWWFTTVRTLKGSIYYTVSEDEGHTWREPKPMHYTDGTMFVNPNATPFICDCGDGKYMQLYYGKCSTYEYMFSFRDKLLQAFGTFAPEDEQPIRFEHKAQLWMQVEAAVGPRMHVTPEINLEGAYTCFRGEPMLWYCDRKHYILGKKVVLPDHISG